MVEAGLERGKAAEFMSMWYLLYLRLGVLDVWNVYVCVVNNPMPILPILMQEILLLEKSLILQNQHFGEK